MTFCWSVDNRISHTGWRMHIGTLTFFCGKMGAGKTTQAQEVGRHRRAVILSEDEWLSSLYPDSIKTLQDYVTFASRLKPRMKALTQSILMSGVDVVMDFPANTLEQRRWFKAIVSEINAPHELIYLDQPNAVCLRHIAQRRIEQPHRAATDTEAMFEQMTQYFVAPTPEEGLTIIHVPPHAANQS